MSCLIEVSPLEVYVGFIFLDIIYKYSIFDKLTSVEPTRFRKTAAWPYGSRSTTWSSGCFMRKFFAQKHPLYGGIASTLGFVKIK